MSAPARVGLFFLGFTSVASLLLWVYGLARFDVAFAMVTLPGTVALVVVAVAAVRTDRKDLRDIMAIGTVAGLIGTLGYDVFRIPFIYGGGFLVLSPIESYGVLAAGADTSSGFTDFLGWSYHVSNGVGFGIAYAAVAMRRHWGWGVVFALLLETGTVVTPFADSYQLSGKWFLIGVAYAAHVPYGLALGKACQHPERTRVLMSQLGRHTAPVALALTVAGLAVWLRPWSVDPDIQRGREVADGPSMIVQLGRVSPEFVVTRPGQCVTIHNSDQHERVLTLEKTDYPIEAQSSLQLCDTSEGVHRLKSDEGPFTGGFLIVDPER